MSSHYNHVIYLTEKFHAENPNVPEYIKNEFKEYSKTLRERNFDNFYHPHFDDYGRNKDDLLSKPEKLFIDQMFETWPCGTASDLRDTAQADQYDADDDGVIQTYVPSDGGSAHAFQFADDEDKVVETGARTDEGTAHAFQFAEDEDNVIGTRARTDGGSADKNDVVATRSTATQGSSRARVKSISLEHQKQWNRKLPLLSIDLLCRSPDLTDQLEHKDV